MSKMVSLGHPVLRATVATVPTDEIGGPRVQKLIGALREELAAQPGVGLAAPQIGESLAVAIVQDRAVQGGKTMYGPSNFERLERVPLPETVLINPRIVRQSDEQVLAFESCLSAAGLVGVVARARSVRVEYSDERGERHSMELRGFPARIVQHEIDHLHGILCIDRMLMRTAMSKEQFYADGWPDRAAEEAVELYGARLSPCVVMA
jgi:peptide deformylase